MKEYVGNFLKMKIENSGEKTIEECEAVNQSHRQLGFNFKVEPQNCKKNPG
jgi:hypothetical protein